MSEYASKIFFHLPLKVKFATVGGFEREFHLAVAFNLPLDGSAVSRVASNFTAFWGASKILKWELRPLFVFVLLQVRRPSILR